MTTNKKNHDRKCIGCGLMKNKDELLRIVKNQSDISIDRTGKTNGRGAYICKSPECLERAVKSKGLERSFKCRITEDIYKQIKEELESFEA